MSRPTCKLCVGLLAEPSRRVGRLLGEIVPSMLRRAWVQHKRARTEPSLVQAHSSVLYGHMASHRKDLFPHQGEEEGRPSVGSVHDMFGADIAVGRMENVVMDGKTECACIPGMKSTS